MTLTDATMDATAKAKLSRQPQTVFSRLRGCMDLDLMGAPTPGTVYDYTAASLWFRRKGMALSVQPPVKFVTSVAVL